MARRDVISEKDREAWQRKQKRRQQQVNNVKACTNCGTLAPIAKSCVICGAPMCIGCSVGSAVCAWCKEGR